MSSLIDFDGDNPSQHSDGAQMLEEPIDNVQPASKSAKSEEDTRREMLSKVSHRRIGRTPC